MIHTVGPVYRDGRHHEPELLASCYRESLALAVKHNVRTIAFPAISCGAYRFPPEEAVKIAIRECAEGLAANHALEKIVFACFDRNMLELYRKHIETI